jgi:hypothetical protein
MSIIDFAGENQEAAGRAALLASVLLTAGRDLMSMFNGAGLIGGPGPFPTGGGHANPLLALNQFHDAVRYYLGPYPPEIGFPLRSLGTYRGARFYHALKAALTHRDSDEADGPPAWFDDVSVWLMPPMSPTAAPGDPIVQSGSGTLGFRVVWPGHDGFLTAGHVATSGSGPVRANAPPGNPVVGNVIYTGDPTGKGAVPGEDVAVIEHGGRPAVHPAFGSRAVSPAALAPVEIHTSRGVVRDTIRAFFQFYYSPTIGGTWGECYMTTNGVTMPGDSGAPVVSASGDPIGTVVAGTRGFADLVQKVDYQIARTGIAGLALA